MTEPNGWHTTENDDSGSLLTGVKLEVGSRIQIEGESRLRKVTYVMGSAEAGWRACFARQGKVPEGKVRWKVAAPPNSSSREGATDAAARNEDLSKSNLKELAFMLRPGQAWGVLTTIAGLVVGAFSAGAWVGNHVLKPASTPSGSTAWLVIDGVEADTHEVARVTVAVNGENFISYPASHVWAEVESTMPSEKYPLPTDVKEYRLRFGAFLSDRGPAPVVEALCHRTETIRSTEIPTSERRCDLFPSSGSYWAAQRIAVIKFSVVTN